MPNHFDPFVTANVKLPKMGEVKFPTLNLKKA